LAFKPSPNFCQQSPRTHPRNGSLLGPEQRSGLPGRGILTGNVGLLASGTLTLNNTTIHGEVDYPGAIHHSVSGTWAVTDGECANVAFVATAVTALLHRPCSRGLPTSVVAIRLVSSGNIHYAIARKPALKGNVER